MRVCRFISVLLLVLGAMGCGGSSDTAPPAGAASDRVISLRVTTDRNGNGALGSLFTLVSRDGSVKCGAGFVSSVSTTVYNNQNDLEFWCRETVEPPVLQWIDISRPILDYPSTLLGNAAGVFFDFIGGSWFETGNQQWVSNPNPGLPWPGSDEFRLIRHDGNELWTVSSGRGGCNGLSFYTLDGYFGTVPMDFVFGAVTVWRRVAYTNFDGRVWATPLPTTPSTSDCRLLVPEIISNEPVHAYAMFPVGDTLFIGGGGAPFLTDSSFACAPILAVSASAVELIELQGCTDRQVAEIYSFTLYDDALYAGTYPDGAVYRIDLATHAATRSAFPEPASDTWASPRGERYRESQSLAVTTDRLLIGIYPWGEIHDYAGTLRVQRPYTAPPKTAQQSRPFELEDDANEWSQRITSIVVLDGRVCIGTGNTFAERHDAGAHPFISSELADEYGRVYCAALQNQALAAYQPAAVTDLAFRITDSDLVIEQGGVEQARAAHTLSEAALAMLESGGSALAIGVGRYGPTQAIQIQRR